MKTHDIPPRGAPRGRRIAGHAQDDHVIDTYKQRHKPAEPSRCPQCGAVYSAGRWQWQSYPTAAAQDVTCPACQRVADGYPAGIVALSGTFVREHRAELAAIARHAEEAEKSEHPLNRIMAIQDGEDGGLVITTTDIHLPRRIGDAVHRAFHGEIDVHYDPEGYFARVTWRRDG